ncbi:MAG: hypothetical protein Q7S28_04395 [bacterium]|nr:hypothetical protein [bacterium]
MRPVIRRAVIVIALAAIAFMQFLYDGARTKDPIAPFTVSPQFARAFDLGLHSALASFLWIDTRTEIPALRDGAKKFMDELALINTLDPKFSTPYMYSVIVLPESRNFPERMQAAVDIGARGVRDADPNWQISFYTAATYQLYLKDLVNAAKYFDIAAHTPGIPDTVRGFAINYGTLKDRDKTKGIWAAIYATTEDPDTKERARAYVAHFEILDLLDRGVGAYHVRTGRYPKTLDDLVAARIISIVPKPPFEGFEYFFDERTNDAQVKRIGWEQ